MTVRDPAFGHADLTNCEREEIHLAGSIQPHGALLLVREPDLVVLQVSNNCRNWFGIDVDQLLGRPLDSLAGTLSESVAQVLVGLPVESTAALRCQVQHGSVCLDCEGTVHRLDGVGVVIELEVFCSTGADPAHVQLSDTVLLPSLAAAIEKFGVASSIGALSDTAARAVRELTGYDRVMIYRFDPDGHGKVIAEARDPRLEALLGHQYPATDIPQRARALYLRNRVRVLVDVNYAPVPLVPRVVPHTQRDLDMSLCNLRSMSPLHLQYLKNMGVTATLVVSLVRDGRLWGLIAAHHYAPRNLGHSMRAACDLLGEVMATRIAAIESYVHTQVAIQVRRLEQRLIEATATEGDWRIALLRNPRTLLQPLEATGAALCYDGEFMTVGESPSTPELRALTSWIGSQSFDAVFHCSAVGTVNPALAGLTPVASGVLAIRLSTARPDFLVWFRKEQLHSVTWAGDPTKPVVGNDPSQLSPRRSFAAWSEMVRGTAIPWSAAEQVLARAFGVALIDIIVQVHAVRLLIAEHQLAEIRATVQSSDEPVLIANAAGSVLFANAAFHRLLGKRGAAVESLPELARCLSEPKMLAAGLAGLSLTCRSWRGEGLLITSSGEYPVHETVPVGIRAELVPGPSGLAFGTVVTLTDLTDSHRAASARQRFEDALRQTAHSNQIGDVTVDANGAQRPNDVSGLFGARGESGRPADQLIGAILTNASVAAMDIADGSSDPSVARLLEDLEASTARAAALYSQIKLLV